MKSSGGFKLEPFGKGRNAIQTTYANELVNCLNPLGKISIVRGKEDKVLYSDAGVTLQIAKAEETSAVGGASSIFRARIVALHYDYLECEPWNGSAYGSEDYINVAKPIQLRRIASTNIYGYSVTYTAVGTNERTAVSSGFDTETHVIMTPYSVNREIMVASVSYPEIVGSDDLLSEVSMDYIDINVDARTWSAIHAIPLP